LDGEEDKRILGNARKTDNGKTAITSAMLAGEDTRKSAKAKHSFSKLE
jgi:hypothetical protein